MVIRSRFLSLTYRFLALAAILTIIVFYFRSDIPPWMALSYWSVLTSFLLCLLFFFELIFNFIDLRRGPRGIPAGINMRLALPLICYSMQAGLGNLILFFLYGGDSLIEVILYLALFILPLFDWLLFDEKGTVPYYTAFTSQIVPIFYAIFSVFRAIIWPNNPLKDGSMYPYPFLDPHSSWFWPGCIICFLCLALFSCLMIFLNNLLSFKRHHAKER
jgi:hypothetical protein